VEEPENLYPFLKLYSLLIIIPSPSTALRVRAKPASRRLVNLEGAKIKIIKIGILVKIKTIEKNRNKKNKCSTS
jgi:hypothetical protein